LRLPCVTVKREITGSWKQRSEDYGKLDATVGRLREVERDIRKIMGRWTRQSGDHGKLDATLGQEERENHVETGLFTHLDVHTGHNFCVLCMLRLTHLQEHALLTVCNKLLVYKFVCMGTTSILE
jgi:hypothetical protein